MKTNLLFVAFNALMLLIHPEGKPIHNKTITTKTIADGSFSAKINGKLYTGKNNHATLTLNYANTGNNIFTVESFSTTDVMAAHNSPHLIFLLHFTGNLPAKGAYTFEDMNLRKPFSTNSGTYDRGWNADKDTGNPTDAKYSFAPKSGGNGALIITVVNTNTVSGKISGTAVNSKGEKMVITEGMFTNLTIH